MIEHHNNFEDIPTVRKEELSPLVRMLATKQYASFQVRLFVEEFMLNQQELLYVQDSITDMMYTGE